MTDGFTFGSGILRCCRVTLTHLMETKGATTGVQAGDTDFCNHCGADLIFDGQQWEFDRRTFERIRKAWREDGDAQAAGEAYSRLFRGTEK